jgi:hypothetical protein
MKILAAAAALATACTVGASTAQAQASIDMARVTCQQYTEGFLEDHVIATMWFSGYLHGRKNNPVVDFKRGRDNANAVIAYCEKNPKDTVLAAARKVLK